MKRTVLLKLTISLFSLFLCVLVLEIILRVSVTHIRNVENGSWLEASPELLLRYTANGRRMRPNASVVIKNHYLSGVDVAIETNAQGFRAAPVSPKKNKNEFRILALGDSITIGDYLPLEQNFTAELERRLVERYSTEGTAVSVINAGVIDIGLEEQVAILEETGLSVEPDMVLLNFYLNDSRPSWGFAEELRHRGWLRRHSLLVELIYGRLTLNNWVESKKGDRFKWIRSQESLHWKSEPADFEKLVADAEFDWGSAWQDSAWQQLVPLLKHIKDLSQKHNFKVLLAVFPVSFQVYSSVATDQPQQRLKQIAKELEFSYIDLLPVLQKNASAEDLFYDQCHPTAKGYRTIGKALYEYIDAAALIQ